MSIENITTQKYNNQYTKINIKHKKKDTPQMYIVPEQNTKSFIENYKKFEKKTSIISNTSFVGSILGSVILASKLTQNIAKKPIKYIINIASGVAGATLGIFGCSKFINNQHTKLLTENNAKRFN